MATTVFMEALSPTMEEGRLVKWHKHEGETVKAGETLAEVETDKAIMDLVARADGVLGQITVKDGETVAVGKAIAIIGGPEEATGRGTGDGGRVATAPTPLLLPPQHRRQRRSPHQRNRSRRLQRLRRPSPSLLPRPQRRLARPQMRPKCESLAARPSYRPAIRRGFERSLPGPDRVAEW